MEPSYNKKHCQQAYIQNIIPRVTYAEWLQEIAARIVVIVTHQN